MIWLAGGSPTGFRRRRWPADSDGRSARTASGLDALHALGGAAVGFAVFLVFYLLGGMGGGDVKLMAGFGALLGLPGVLWAALWTAAFGGVIAIGAVAWQAAAKVLRRASTISNEVRERQESIPYAPAIVLGVWLSLVPKG